VQEETNVSRDGITKPQESEEEISKNLAKYIENSYKIIRTFTVGNFFDVANLLKFIKAATTRSPHLLSLLALVALLFGGPVQNFFSRILPKELGLDGPHLLGASALLVAAAALWVHYARARMSIQEDKIRQWIVQLSIIYGWKTDRFVGLLQKELQQLDYASFVNLAQTLVQRDPTSVTNLLKRLPIKEGSGRQEDISQLFSQISNEDFARKIQALTGVAGEPGYRPKYLAVRPFF
jgi:hypothetical protein